MVLLFGGIVFITGYGCYLAVWLFYFWSMAFIWGMVRARVAWLVRAQACAVDLRDCVFNFMTTFELILSLLYLQRLSLHLLLLEENKSLLFEASSQAILTKMQCSRHIFTQIEAVGKKVDPHWPSMCVHVCCH